MTVLGEKKGIPDEVHFVITVRFRCGAQDFEEEREFDIYADTVEEAEKLLTEYIDSIFIPHGFTREGAF